jgi:hypothetical protein
MNYGRRTNVRPELSFTLIERIQTFAIVLKS